MELSYKELQSLPIIILFLPMSFVVANQTARLITTPLPPSTVTNPQQDMYDQLCLYE